jgi:membrane-associated HD superfamily phosphohydrolase
MENIIVFFLLLFILVCEYFLILKGKNTNKYYFLLFVFINLIVFFLHKRKKDGKKICTHYGLLALVCIGILLFIYTETTKQKYEMLIKMIALFMFIYS